jgi:uncharacterized protein (TIGR03437 family)
LLLLLAGFPVAYGQQYSISTVAGGAPPATPAVATGTAVGKTKRVILDKTGNVYFTAGNCVFKLSGSNLVLVAGNGRAGFAGDGGLAVNAEFNDPFGLALDQNGNLFVADSLNNRIRVIDSTGVINTWVGNGTTGSVGAYGDGGPSTSASLNNPLGVAVDSFGQVYVADTGNNMIRKVTLSGTISTIAGNGLPGYSGDKSVAINAELNHPADLLFDTNYNLLIADTGNSLVRRITTDNVINIFAGNTTEVGYYGDTLTADLIGLFEPYSIVLDAAGDLYIVERGDGRVRVVTYSTAITNTMVGNGALGFSGDSGAANLAMLNQPTGIGIDSAGNLYIADSENCRIRKAASGGGTNAITTIAGNGGVSYSGDGGQATKAQLNTPQGVAADSSGNLYIADTANHAVRKVTAAGVISTLAGTGTAGYSGDGSAAAGAQLRGPQGVAVDSSGNVYIADTGNSRVRKVTSGGSISTYAGSGTAGYGGDGAAASSAQLNTPLSLAADSAGNLYIADFGNNVVRKVSASGGAISTVAGNGIQGFGGDGGKATAARLNGPQAVAVDSSGNLYIADSQNSRIRVVTPDGTITTVAGTGIPGYSGDGRLALSAQIANPAGLAVDSTGSVYITDSSALVRKFYVGGPIVSVAGNSTVGYSGDGGVATLAQLDAPIGLAVNSKGVVYIADSGNGAIRSLQATGAGSSIAAVVSAASDLSGTVAPGEALVLYGTGLGPAGGVVSSAFGSNGALPTSLAGTAVYFNGTPGAILYTSANQVSAIVPFGVTGSSVQIYVAYQSQTSAPVAVTLVAAAPAFFTLDYSGKGQAVAVNSGDASLNGTAHPAAAGSYILLYATGLGQTNPAGVDGSQVGAVLPLPLLTPTATIGGKAAVVQYAGGATGIVAGVSQINLQIPTGLTPGANAVVLTSGGVASPAGVTIELR